MIGFCIGLFLRFKLFLGSGLKLSLFVFSSVHLAAGCVRCAGNS